MVVVGRPAGCLGMIVFLGKKSFETISGSGFNIDVNMLTFDAGYFSSQAAIDTFRIGWITSRNAFESFFNAYIMANSIKMIIPCKLALNYRFF